MTFSDPDGKNFFPSGFFLLFCPENPESIPGIASENRFSQQNDNSVVRGKKKATDGRRAEERRRKRTEARRFANRSGKRRKNGRHRDTRPRTAGQRQKAAGHRGTQNQKKAGQKQIWHWNGEPVCLEPGAMEEFFRYLEENRRGDGTLESYRRTLLSLYEYLPEEKTVSRQRLLDWKEEMLSAGYAVRTVNARVSAVNSFLEYRDRRDLQIHPVSAPKNDAVPELTRREYLRLLNTARMLKRERTYFLIKTICCAGVRVQQLSQVTVEAVEAGSAVIRGQCGSQVLHIPPVLREELLAYAGRHGIRSGPVFITRNGSPINRSNVSDSIRRLCRDAQVPEEKGNPRCLLKLHQATYRNIQNSVAVLIEQAYDRMLEEEQLSAGWEEEG